MTTEVSKMLMAQNQFANTTTVWVLFLFLGWSYGSLGKIGIQILFYITFGGFGIWALIRLFTLSGAIKAYNKKVAMRLGLSADEMMQLGVI
tara:strand:+ start:628 stop:900 length:273 start_codon:yes stop_codon:yes gene_type:complete